MKLRELIQDLEKQNRLNKINQCVDWKYEIGKIASDSKLPVLFENIKDYPGFRLFAGGMNSAGFIALSLGLPYESSKKEIINSINKGFYTPVKPMTLYESEIWDHSQVSGDINLYSLPVPWWNKLDGGRFIGTWHLNITKDPQTGIRNAGVYRMQILDYNRMSVSVSPKSHLAFHMKKAEQNNQALPMAACIGVDEVAVLAGAAAFPCGTDEFEVIGGIQKKPLQIVPCRTIDMEVPLDSEIAIEGNLLPGIRVKDGPFIDYAGIPSSNPNSYVCEVTALHYKEHAVFRGTSVGKPGAEDHQLYSLLSSCGFADFHGSRVRKHIQNLLLRRRMFKIFQMTGRTKKMLKI